VPIKTHFWKVGDVPQMLSATRLASEQQLEGMICSDPRLLSDEWLLIGRQEHTGFGGIVDLLALAPDGSVVLVELKRNKTPRDVVAQALEYASWVESLDADDLAAIFNRFSQDHDLGTEFQKKFGHAVEEDELNQSHQIIIVAAELDASTERIVSYLNQKGISVNVLFFQVFSAGDDEYISRTWLIDPVEAQASAPSSKKKDAEPWNGEFYCSFGDGKERSWAEARKYGFICGGGGAWYSRTLQLLEPGDRVWAKVTGSGFVGVGRVTGAATPAAEFQLSTEEGDKPAFDVLTKAGYHREFLDDEERCEYFIPVEWLDTESLEQAVQEVGMFGNQNTVCKPTSQKWRTTIERLKGKFPNYDGRGAEQVAPADRQPATLAAGG
jgi:hypothetical protein